MTIDIDVEIQQLKVVLVVKDCCPQCKDSSIITIIGYPKEFTNSIQFYCRDHGFWEQILDFNQIDIMLGVDQEERHNALQSSKQDSKLQ